MISDAIYLTCDYSAFVTYYIEANKTKDSSSIEACLKAFDESFLSLSNKFKTFQFQDNILLATLISLVKKDNKPEMPLSWKLNVYFSYLANNNLTFYDHLQESFLCHLNHEKIIYSKYPKPYKLFYYISQELKMYLFKIIRRICQSAKRDYYTNSSYFSHPKMYVNLYLDTTFLETLEKENPLLFSFYMLSISTHFNRRKIKQALNLNDPQYRKIKEELCQLTKKLISTN